MTSAAKPDPWLHPDFRVTEYDGDISADARCMQRTDGTHMCPAAMVYFGTWKHSHVLLSLEIGPRALFTAWTPEGARMIAAQLVELAALVEQNTADEAAAKLAAIAKGGAA